MSSDLLAEFDSFYRAPQNGIKENAPATSDSVPTTTFEDLSSIGSSNLTNTRINDLQPQRNVPVSKPSDDIWGNFETINAGHPEVMITTVSPHPGGGFLTCGNSFGNQQNVVDSNSIGHEGSYQTKTSTNNPHIIRRSTIDLFSSDIAVLDDSTPSQQPDEVMAVHSSTRTIIPHTRTENPNKKMSNVLFDAAEELDRDEDDDEFGDFETVSSPLQIDLLQMESSFEQGKATKGPREILMLDSGFQESPFPYPQAPKSPSFRERNPFADLVVTTPSVSKTKKANPSENESPMTAWPEYESKIPTPDPYHDIPSSQGPEEEEDWGDFENLPPVAKDVKPPTPGIKMDARSLDAINSQNAPITITPAEIPPPTNIPPPSVLLAIFPQLFNLPHSSLFQSVANQPFALKSRILSDPSTIDFLRAYTLLATVAARIIVGRKLRWKRDTHLSQAMKIGPAVARGKGGMKLMGVDKAETAREDREAADLVRIWRDQVGRLRSAVAAANSSLHDQSMHLAVPEITESMLVKTEGVLTAPKACVLCGLKREERIPKVDLRVEDSFEEWWVEHWGHRSCRNFWQEHENKLKQR